MKKINNEKRKADFVDWRRYVAVRELWNRALIMQMSCNIDKMRLLVYMLAPRGLA